MLTPARQLGSAVRSLREQSNLSQEKLAMRASIQRTYLSEIERGTRNPNLETLVKLAHALGIRASELLSKAEQFGAKTLIKSEEQVLVESLQREVDYLRRTLSAQRAIAASSGVAPGEVPRHGHVCLFYSSSAEQIKTITPFFQTWLAQKNRCVYICDETPPAAFLDGLRSNGFDLIPYLRTGALTILNKYDTYLYTGEFCQLQILSKVKQLAKETVEQGYSGLRCAAEMTWAISPECNSVELIQYEHMVQNIFPDFDMVGICLYNRKRFSPELLREMILCHPIIADRDHLMNNCFYSSQSEAPDEIELVLEINRMCAGLR